MLTKAVIGTYTSFFGKMFSAYACRALILLLMFNFSLHWLWKVLFAHDSLMSIKLLSNAAKMQLK